jgi:hypothetical protein
MQKMTPVLSVLGISALSLAFAACSIDVSGQAIVKREEKRFTVNGPAELTLRTFDGSIRLKSWDRSEVLVEIERRGPDEKSTEALVVNATQDGNRIVVDAPEPRSDSPRFMAITLGQRDRHLATSGHRRGPHW